jgi:hypothetical protein
LSEVVAHEIKSLICLRVFISLEYFGACLIIEANEADITGERLVGVKVPYPMDYKEEFFY